jgi:Raf kinase inhibitor-like YbhB/YbcL family protein
VSARRHAALLALAATAAAAGCGGGDTVKGGPPAAAGTIRLTSAAFPAGATMPRRYTCSGDDVSPPLAWSGVPSGARSLALLVEDHDAPGGTFVHWTLWDLPPRTTALAADTVPPGAKEGKSSFGKEGYGGPCPPKGDQPHHYNFLLYALRARLGLAAGASPGDVRSAVAKQALARGTLTGRFGR